MHIVADENMPALDEFERLGRVTRVDGRGLTRADLRAADILLVRSVTPVTEALLAGTPVRFVGSATIGTDHVDLPALDRLGIAFACAPGCNARAVAEYVLQALLMASQHYDRPLRGSTVGVVGLGNVGGLVAAWLRALGVEVLGCDPPLARAGRVPSVSLDEALSADHISLHVPLIKRGEEATVHLLDKTRLQALHERQTLINTCRGPVVDNVALARRLARGDGPLTFLDVWEGEPRLDPALLERVFLGSPHVAGYSVEGKRLGSAMLYEAWCQWQGEPAPPAPLVAERRVVAQDVEDESQLLALLRHAHRLPEDDQRLRRSLRESDPGAAFDQLRKRYPPRHELHHWRHQGKVAPSLQALVNLLFESNASGSARPAPALYRPAGSSPR
ncbi:MAG TPA: 4-phosphoerythronate dehydrogenase [Alcanivorax sp.]|nr:4-phosphoerythronate dehydrogenase [Alcanivorax sp.]